MTDFDKIREYYSEFNENDRLISDSSGRLEFEMTMKKLEKHLPAEATILDLGGATGVYTFPLAKKGYKMYLADLSDTLIEQAKNRAEQSGESNVISCDVVNAIDLSRYSDGQFDVVLLFGPLYHLLDEQERATCVKEINRVLKPGGMVFASFIPYLSGSIAIVDRYFRHPEQVNSDNLREVFKSGRFNNSDTKGFQEGYYPTSDEIEILFNEYGFNKVSISSIRGFGYEKEDKIYSISDKSMFDEIINLIEETSADKSIIETCGHAMYIGVKR
ncbi:MAG: methyltransferase domain-containing protein [Clostridia bacterium]|nr:methyltransferase domain-containing protein [Clostridia bacterium]